VLIWH